METKTIIEKTEALIDALRATCSGKGLSGDSSEYKIIVQVFLYKFLNDKFGYLVKNTESDYQERLKDAEHLDECIREIENNLGWHYGVDLVIPMSYAVLKNKKRLSKRIQDLMETIEHRYGGSIYWDTFTQPLSVARKKRVKPIKLDTNDLLKCLEKYHGIPFIQVQQADIYVNSPGNIVSKEIKYGK